MSYHKFNEFARRDATIQRLKLGGILALISDAGMPGISDPGTDLVRDFINQSILYMAEIRPAFTYRLFGCDIGEGMCGIQCAGASRSWSLCCHHCLGCLRFTN